MSSEAVNRVGSSLLDFVMKDMRMSHIYQPVMLATLLGNGGECSEREIARRLLVQDESQIDYYRSITNNMVGQVLRKRGWVSRDAKTKTYRLSGYDELSHAEIQQIIELCESKISEFLTRRGSGIFEHRKKSKGYISGTLRYEILKRARFRCELCGISADEKALELDHILPRNHGGTDDRSNLQALCYSCNAMKRDRDDTDFREIRESYEKREGGCLFCEIEPERVVAENELAYGIYDGFPVTERHALVIPKRHLLSYFDLGQAEINACNQLLHELKRSIEESDRSVSGFNMGTNSGQSAGQSVMHCHMHLIPRRDGDVADPRGGVRHVIPNKGYY
jgi:ATP adenylyltransferase